jgi:hypothetical protein
MSNIGYKSVSAEIASHDDDCILEVDFSSFGYYKNQSTLTFYERGRWHVTYYQSGHHRRELVEAS